ncbi:MAG: hypothetical protein ABDH49_04405 [Candidatus Hydrothermales bacterium]
MKKVFLLGGIIIGLVLLYNCKKEKKTEPKPQTQLNQQTAQAIAPIVAQGFGFLIYTMFEPDTLTISPFGKIGANKTPCVEISGDTTDSDGDGYFKDAKMTYNCTVQYPDDPNSSLVFSGEFIIKDKDDNDSTSGFYIEVNNFEFKFIQGNTPQYTIRSNSRYDIDKIGTDFSGHIYYEYKFITTEEISWSIDLDIDYTPDNPGEPWVAGTFNYAADFEIKYAGVTYALRVIGEDLHFDENKDCEYPDRGKVKVTDGHNYITITYSCNSYTADYNGVPIALAR